MATAAPPHDLPASIQSKLGGLRWGIRAYIWLEGCSLGVIWLALTFWLGLGLDYFLVVMGADELPQGVRAVMLCGVAAGLVYIGYRWILRRTFVPLADRSMAILLERRFDVLRDSLVTSVEMKDASQAEPFSEDMLKFTSEEAVDRVRQVHLRKVFRFGPLMGKLALALVSAASFFFFAQTPAVTLWAKRLYLLDPQTWPRTTRIEVVGVELQRIVPGAEERLTTVLMPFTNQRLKVARGTNLKLKVTADPTKQIPESCTIYYHTSDGYGRASMSKVGKVYSFGGLPFKGVVDDIRFDVVGRDHRLRDYIVDVVCSPELTSLEVHCLYPEYMRDEENLQWTEETIPYRPELPIPRGTRVTLKGQTNKSLVAVEIFDPDEPGASFEPAAIDSNAFSHAIESLNRSTQLQITITDADGVVSERPHYISLVAVDDAPPTVAARLRGIGSAVTPDVILPTTGMIKDDYGLDRAWFEIQVGDKEPQQREFTVPASGELNAALDFRLERTQGTLQLAPQDKLYVTVTAQDHCNLYEQPNIGVGDRYELDVVTPDELKVLLEGREIGLRRRFEQIVEEVTLMRDSLNHVRPQSAADAEGREPGDGTEPGDAQEEYDRQKSLRLLRVQRAIQQSNKSTQEILGVDAEILDIRDELINNRVAESESRKERLAAVAEKLNPVAEQMFPELDVRLDRLEKGLQDPEILDSAALAALEQNNLILVELQDVLKDMLDIETYNELLDIMRSLIGDQDGLMKDTEKERKKGFFGDFLPNL